MSVGSDIRRRLVGLAHGGGFGQLETAMAPVEWLSRGSSLGAFYVFGDPARVTDSDECAFDHRWAGLARATGDGLPALLGRDDLEFGLDLLAGRRAGEAAG